MAAEGQVAIWWVRRDFRLADNPALRAAIDDGEAVLPLFVLDPALLSSAGRARRAWLMAALVALDHELREAGGPGTQRGTRQARRCRAAAGQGPPGAVGCTSAPTSGRTDDRETSASRQALSADGIELSRTGSPYAVAPGTLKNRSGEPFQVFSPFHRAWLEHGVHDPAPAVRACSVTWLAAEDRLDSGGARPGAAAAGRREAGPESLARPGCSRDSEGVADYAKLHDFPGTDATSHLSIALRWGHLHPRTVLHDLARCGPRAPRRWPARSPGGTSSPMCCSTGRTR